MTIYLINKRHGSRILKEIASRANHTSYRKVYFNEFVQNSLGCNMGVIIYVNEVLEAIRGKKLYSDGKKKHEGGVDFLKNVFDKSCSTTSKIP